MADAHPITPEVAAHVWAWLHAHGLSPRDLAVKANLSLEIVQKVLSGCGYVRMRTRLKLVAATGMTWWSLNEPLERDYTPGLTASGPTGARCPVNFRGSPDSPARDMDHVAIGQPGASQTVSHHHKAGLMATLLRSVAIWFIALKHRRA